MKRSFIILLVLLFDYLHVLHAQNLVPNPSFEEHDNCPSIFYAPTGSQYPIAYNPQYDSFPTATYWVSPLLNTTPDYYNTCDTAQNGHGMPLNVNGYQQSHSGSAYAGLIMYNFEPHLIDDYREYVEAKLLQPLVAGNQYTVSFYVSLTCPYFEYGSAISVDKIGAYLTKDMIDDSFSLDSDYITAMPSIESAPGWFITDTVNWTKISGTYTAQGGEQWITLGHFNDGLPQKDTIVVDDKVMDKHCYMYLDDVCVMDMTANTSDTTICTAAFPVTVSGIDAPGSYLWNTGDTTASIQVTQPGTYWRRATGDCLYYTDTIHVAQLIPALHLGSDTVICKQSPLTLTAPAAQGLQYRWNTGDTTCCITADSTGVYALSVSGACGTATDSIAVTVLPVCEECLWVPSAFTPNGDGRNDNFKIAVRCPLQSYKIIVFNRWGQEVFSSSDANDSWDGSYLGASPQTGVYFYYIEYQTALPGTTKQIMKGDITVIR